MKALAKCALQAAAIMFLGLVALASQAFADGGAPVWTNFYHGPGNADHWAKAVAIDSSGNVLVAGSSDGGGGNKDFAAIKYSNLGLPVWTNRYKGPRNGDEDVRGVAVDRSSNVFVTGQSIGAGNYDYATIKYSDAGVSLWTNRYNGPSNGYDVPQAIAVDGSGNVFVTGGSLSSDSASGDCASVAYSSAGAPLWTHRYDGPASGNDYANAVAVDGNGNVFVTGFTTGADGTLDYWTVAYSGVGVPLWTNIYSGPGNGDDDATAIAVDHSGNVFVTGVSDGGGGTFDYATVAYSVTGAPLWTNRYNGGADSFRALAIAVDTSGNVFVTGGSSTDYATVAYSNVGVPLWTNICNGSGWARALGMDSSGNLFVTGASATVAYSGAGVPLWTNRYDGPGKWLFAANALAVDFGGNVFVTGNWVGSGFGSGGRSDYATIKYSSSVPAVHLDFQKMNNQFILTWTNPGFSLQSAPFATGAFTNIPGATNPYTNPITGLHRYFRLTAP